jgi:hypothetical protein
MKNGLIDLIVYVGGTLILFGFWMTAGREFAPQLFGVWMFACAFAWAAILKVLWRQHVALSRVSWSYLALIGPLAVGGAYLASDFRVLGFWTMPALIGIVLAAALVVWRFGPRFGDDDPNATR